MKKLKIFMLLICLFATSICFYGCNEVKVQSVSFNQQKITLVEGSTDYEVFANVVANNSKLVATVLPYNAKNRAVSFEVDNSEIIEIVNNKIHAKSEGVAHITVTTKDGNFSTSAVVEVVSETSKLSTVENLRFENGKVVWDAVANANYYTVILNNGIHSETVVTEFADFESGVTNKIQIIANSLGNAYSSSNESAVYTFKQLANPDAVSNNNYNLTWNAVVGAVSYEVFVDNVKVNSESITNTNFTIQQNLVNDGNAHSISIIANGDNETTFQSKLSNAYQVQVLSAPTSILISQGIVMFNEVPYANTYNVKIGNEIYSTSSTTFKIPEEVNAGEHSLTIQAVGAINNFIASDFSQTTLSFIKLAEIPNFTVSNNTISWNKVTNAGGYLISINNNIYNLGTVSSFYFGEEFEAGEYEIKIASVGTGNQYVMSNFTESKTLTKLPVPENLQILNGKITYNAVENASSYILDINGVKKSISSNLISNNVASLDVALESGNYNIKVQAVGNGTEFLNSSFSQAVNTTKLDLPSAPILEDGLIKWKAVRNAFGYNVKLNQVVYEFNSLETDGNMVVLDLSSIQYADETYSVQVQALSSAENINSDYSANVDFKKFKTPETLKAHFGNFAFTYNNNVSVYELNVNGQTSYLNKENLMVDNSANPTLYIHDFKFENANNSLTIKIKAQGTDEYISSDFSQEEIFNVCSKIENLKISENILSFQNKNDGNVLIECSGKTDNGSVISIEEKETMQTSYSLPNFMGENLPGGVYTFIVRAQGNSINTLSGVKQNVSTTILNAPTNFKVDSGKIIWNGASNVSGYKLQIFNAENKQLAKEMEVGNVTSISLAGYTDLEEEKDYLISIQSIGNGTSTISSSFINEGEQVTACILAKPSNLKVVDGEIKWDKVNNATVYGLYIDGKLSNIKAEEIETLQEGIPYGTHNIKVYALGDSTKYLSSDVSLTFEVVKLETPSNIHIKKDAITNKATLYCDMPAYSSALKITKEHNNEKAGEDEYLQELYAQGIAVDISEYESGYYTFKAQAVGDSTKYISSSQTLGCSTTIMACPENVYLNKGVLTWSSVTGVQSYNVYINYYGKHNAELVSSEEKTNIQNNSYILNTDFQQGYYQISVKAIGDETKFVSSQKSNVIDVEKLGIPSGLSTEAGVIVFNELQGAYEYAIYVDGKECGRTKKETTSVIKYELPEEVSSGNHQISIQAIGDDTKYITGETGATVLTGGTSVEVIGATMEVIKLAPVNEFKLENGVLTWLPIEIASGYSLKINQINFEEEIEQTTTKSSYTFGEEISAGKKVIKLKSIGQNLADGRRILNSNYTSALTAVKLEKVVNVHASYGTEINDCGVIKWNRVPNNNGYIISIEGINKEIITEVNQETYEFVSSSIPSGKLKIKIKAIGTNSTSTSTSNYISGDNSSQVEYEKLSTPTNFKIKDGKLNWDYNSGYSFVVSITSNGEENCFVVNEQSAVVNTSFKSGTYDIKVKAQGKIAEDGTELLNSSYTSIISAVKPEKPTNVTVDEFGVVTWNEDEKAECYVVIATYTAPGGTSEETEIKYENLTENICYLGASGIYKFKVYAVSEQGLYSDGSNEIQTVLDGFVKGDGSQSNPYEVSNVQDFIRVSKYPEAHFKQINDIDMNNAEINAMFVEKEFVGNYNGQNFKVSNLKVSGSATQQELGLFSVIGETGVVRNLKLENISMQISSLAGVGGIAGKNFGTISNCSISGKVYNLTNADMSSTYALNIGGVVAYNAISGIVELCESNVEIKGIIENSTILTRYYVTSGAIAGANYGTIKKCITLNNANVYGNVSGGISGLNAGRIEQCVNNASVQGTNILYNGAATSGYAGGIVGSNSSNGTAIIYNCYNLSNNIKCVNTTINSTSYNLYASGIAGLNNSSNTNEAKIINCYNYAKVIAYTVDGINYYNSSICYNAKNGYVDYFYYSTSTLDEAVRNGKNKVSNYEQKTEANMKTEQFASELNQNISTISASQNLSSFNLSAENCWKLLSTGIVGFEWQEPTQE